MTAGWNEAAQLYDTLTGKRLGSALHHGDNRIRALAFSPDGKILVTGGRDKMARLWDAGIGKSLGPPLPHRDFVFAAAFSADSRQIATGGDKSVAFLWEVAEPIEGSANSVRLRVEALTGLHLDAHGVATER